MSDTQTTVDTTTEPVATSTTVAPPTPAGETQGSTPAPADTAVPSEPKPAPTEQSPRRDRAFATLRRENRELHRQFGYMQAQMENLRGSVAPPAEGDQPPQQRQAQSPPPADQDAQADLNRSILERIEDEGEEYEEVVEKITARNFPMTVAMRDYLATSDKAALVAKALADDPKEARRISLLSERAADRAMERLEQGIKPAKAAPKTSTAPPPVPTVGGRSSPSFDPEKASMEEFAVDWHARQAAKRR